MRTLSAIYKPCQSFSSISSGVKQSVPAGVRHGGLFIFPHPLSFIKTNRLSKLMSLAKVVYHIYNIQLLDLLGFFIFSESRGRLQQAETLDHDRRPSPVAARYQKHGLPEVLQHGAVPVHSVCPAGSTHR